MINQLSTVALSASFANDLSSPKVILTHGDDIKWLPTLNSSKINFTIEELSDADSYSLVVIQDVNYNLVFSLSIEVIVEPDFQLIENGEKRLLILFVFIMLCLGLLAIWIRNKIASKNK